jgi:hypothetical protein
VRAGGEGEDGRMKRLIGVLLGAICLNLILMAPALAGSELPPPAGDVAVPPGANDPTAFTGANVEIWMMVLAVALLAAGVTLFLTGRRRRATAE